MKLIISGSRSLHDYSLIDKAVAYASTCDPPLDMSKVTTIIEGEANGIDKLARIWSWNHRIPVLKMPAKWDDLKAKGAIIKSGFYGKFNAMAGFDRNEEMAKYVGPKGGLLAIVKLPSPGTEHMIECAKSQGLQVWVYEI